MDWDGQLSLCEYIQWSVLDCSITASNSMLGTDMVLSTDYKMISLVDGDFSIKEGIDGGVCIKLDLPLVLFFEWKSC